MLDAIHPGITGIYDADSEVGVDKSPLFVTPKALGNEVFQI